MVSKLSYVLIKEFLLRLLDEEKREKLVYAICIGVSIILLFLTFIYYITTSPLTLLLEVTGLAEDSNTAIVLETFKNDEQVKNSFSAYRFGERVEYNGEGIPLYFQYDSRWSGEPYAGGTIGDSGCGTTALSMVVVGLTGNTTVSPSYMAEFSTNSGYAVYKVGTSWSLMTDGAEEFGLTAEKVSSTAENIVKQLSSGKVMITSMSPGTFTKTGHFIVLAGLTEDGMVIVNDSGSQKLSNITFTPELIASECKAAWTFSYDKEKKNVDSIDEEVL